VTAGMTVPLLVWSHHLTNYQRNGGEAGYTALFLVWASLVAATLILWTVVAVVVAQGTSFSGAFVAVEAGLAVAVAAAMVVIVIATILWWISIAEGAPSFLSADPSVPLNAQLVTTVVVMLLAAEAAMTGVVRIIQSWPSAPASHLGK
jgi:hypothetical protein